MGANGNIETSMTDARSDPDSDRRMSLVRGFVARNWKVGLYVILILLCVLFAPEEPLKFIYTEF
jgi:hypothetical protein